MLIPQCETLECLADIENIVSVEGISGIFIGPFDLSLAMGTRHSLTDQNSRKLLRKCLRYAMKRISRYLSWHRIRKSARLRLEQGFDSVTVNGDLNVMTEAYMEIVKSIRA